MKFCVAKTCMHFFNLPFWSVTRQFEILHANSKMCLLAAEDPEKKYLSAICPALDTRNVSSRGFYHGSNHLWRAASAGHERRPADRVRVKIKRLDDCHALIIKGHVTVSILERNTPI
jgi:hypothetical protein